MDERRITIKKNRMAGLDILRIICALLIFMRHSITMFGCTYYNPQLDNLVQQLTSPVMSAFFVISGFSLYYSQYGKPDLSTEYIKDFYVKRITAIFPAYLLIHILWLFFSTDPATKWFVLTPFEIAGLQSMYTNIFGVLHSGGTWFISCLAVAYFIFPLLRGLIGKLSHKWTIIITIAANFFVVYLICVETHYQLGDNYANPVFRTIEFSLGVILMAALVSGEKQNISFAKQIVLLLASFVMAALFIFVIHGDSLVLFGSIYKSGLILYPLIALTLIAAYYWRCRALENSKALAYLSTLSYHFFLMQFITWNITGNLMAAAGLEGNMYKVILSFLICSILSVFSKELTERIVRSLKRRKKERSAKKPVRMPENKTGLTGRTEIKIIVFICMVVAALVPDIGIKFSIAGFVWTIYRIVSFAGLVIVVFVVDRKLIVDKNSESAKWLILIIFWVLYGIVLLLISPYSDMHKGIVELIAVFNGGILIWISSSVSVSKRLIDKTANVISIIAVGFVLLGFAEIITGWHMPTSLVAGDGERAEELMNTAMGLMYNPNDFSAFITALFPICMMNKWIRWPYLAGIIVINTVNDAKTCTFAIIIMFIYWLIFFYSGNSKRKVSGLMIAVLSIVTVYAACMLMGIGLPGSEAFLSKMEWIINDAQYARGSLSMRMGMYKDLFTAFIHTFGLGMGPAGIAQYFEMYPSVSTLVNPHAFLLELLAEYGIIIFSWFIVRVVKIIMRVHQLFKKDLENRKYYIAAGEMMIVYLIVSFAPSSFIGYSYQWLIIAFSCMMLRLGKAEEEPNE